MACDVCQGQRLCPIQIIKQLEECVCMGNNIKSNTLARLFVVNGKLFRQEVATYLQVRSLANSKGARVTE